MRDSILLALVLALFWAALALLALPGAARAAAPGPDPAVTAAQTTQPSGAPAAAEEGGDPAGEASACFDTSCTLRVQTPDGVKTMDLRSYLTGVLAAELPGSFSEEARKAQAVACRTYALRSRLRPRHADAALCTDAGCCQGWKDPASLSPADRAREEAALAATDGLALYYEGALIDATFFSCSGGRTEDAAAVWGGELPYLRAVASPGEEDAPRFRDETRVPLAEFRAALEEADGAVSFPEAPGAWVGSVRYTAGGGVAEIELGGRPFRGTWLRKRFGLRSTAFQLEISSEEAVFRTRGFGHRVGLSQYGAEAMARAGSDFAEILRWYYQGVEIAQALPDDG